MTHIKVWFPFEPQPKLRPRFKVRYNHVSTFTPPATKAFENQVAEMIKSKAKEMGPISVEEVGQFIKELSVMPFVKPILEDARTKMASRDFALRDVYHNNIAEYLKAVSPEEYEKFIGSQSVDFDHLLDENKEVLDRLKQ